MDLLAALALVLILEGLGVAIFARSLPELLAEMQAMDRERLRWAGVLMSAAGVGLYLAIRGWS